VFSQVSAGPRIFLSYRRDDASGYAGYLFENLRERFGTDRVFMDIEPADPAEDFEGNLRRTLEQCDTVVVLIGPNWVGHGDQPGSALLHDAGDPTRRQVEAAFASQSVRVMPVLVGGAHMPSEHDLPASLVGLTRLQTFELSSEGWYEDVRSLADHIDDLSAFPVPMSVPTIGPSSISIGDSRALTTASGEGQSPRRSSTRRVGWLAVAIVVVVAAALVIVGIQSSPTAGKGSPVHPAQVSLIAQVTSVPDCRISPRH
jgi:hypothetical protein